MPRFTYHDDSSRLLCCAHTHDGCHANGGALEINPTTGQKTEVITSYVCVSKGPEFSSIGRNFSTTRPVLQITMDRQTETLARLNFFFFFSFFPRFYIIVGRYSISLAFCQHFFSFSWGLHSMLKVIQKRFCNCFMRQENQICFGETE